MVPSQMSLNPSSVARWLGIVASLLVITSIGTTTCSMIWPKHHYYPLALFYLDAEQNIPTFFSSCLLLFSALILTVITILEKRRSPDTRVMYWGILSFGFLLMAIDEFVGLHERLISPMRKLLSDDKLGIFYFAWVIPAIILVIGSAFFFWRFLFQLPRKTRRIFFGSATIYLLGCIGCEMIGGYYSELYGQQNLTYSLIATVEESLEMMGVIIFIWGLLTYVADNYQEIRLQFYGVRQNTGDNRESII
jgi:hypothetical protein